MKKIEEVKEWVKEHRVEIAAGAAVAVTGTVLLLVAINRNGKASKISKREMTLPIKRDLDVKDIVENDKLNIIDFEEYMPLKKAPHHVNGHPMKLAEGKKVSEEIKCYIEANGIELPPNHTYRREHDTGKVSA